MDVAAARTDRRLRRARMVALVTLGTGVWSSLVMPGIGLLREPSPLWIGLGAIGILAFAAAHSGALYAAVTPWLAEAARRRFVAGFVAAAALSVPLVGPVGAGHWATWAWLGASIIGTAPVLGHRAAAVLATAATLATAAGVAWWTGGSTAGYLLISGSVGAGIAVGNWLQVWFWDLLVQAREGQAAQGRLAAAEERLRFARDVHDLLGHNLTIIALKAELAARLAPVDAERASREAAEVQRLAASALTDVREAVHGYRAVDLREQLAAMEHVLRSSGVRCTIVPPTAELRPEVAIELGAVLREASTNVLRHSRAGSRSASTGTRSG
jgi:two-component system sensor histidine kinase DesK